MVLVYGVEELSSVEMIVITSEIFASLGDPVIGHLGFYLVFE